MKSIFGAPPTCREGEKCKSPNTCETIMNIAASY